MKELELDKYHHRLGKENNLPDYLTRVPNLEIDAGVQDESTFEDKVFTLDSADEKQAEFAQVAQELPPTSQIAELLDYFQSTYNNIGRTSLGGNYQTATFPIDLWNYHYDTPLGTQDD